jgi:cytochrome oxidase Cu insertion factor (SCO1/SenC/PrrC family)
MGTRPRLLLPAIAIPLIIAAVAFAIIAGSGSSSPQTVSVITGPGTGFDGAALPSGEVAPDFTLRDQHGANVSLSSFRGRPVVIAFPYTACHRSCVLLAEQIRGALDELKRPPAVLLISADPVTDTPARVRAFLERVALYGRASYLTGTREQLLQVWREYHVRPASAGAAVYDKYATVLLIDGHGDERVLYQEEQLIPEALAHDIRKLEGG